MPRSAWSYVGLREARRIVVGLGISAAVLFVLRVVSTRLEPVYYFAQYGYNPGGVILIDFVLAVLGVAGARVLRRMVAERPPAARPWHRIVERPTLLVGAGQAGVTVAREIGTHPELGIRPIGFLDDDPVKIGTEIQGIPVLGPTSRGGEIARRTGATEVLITIANASGADIRRIQQLCDGARGQDRPRRATTSSAARSSCRASARWPSRTCSGASRSASTPELIERFVRGKRVLVTGAGGASARSCAGRSARFSPATLVLVEQAENNLFHIHDELSCASPGVQIGALHRRHLRHRAHRGRSSPPSARTSSSTPPRTSTCR